MHTHYTGSRAHKRIVSSCVFNPRAHSLNRNTFKQTVHKSYSWARCSIGSMAGRPESDIKLMCVCFCQNGSTHTHTQTQSQQQYLSRSHAFTRSLWVSQPHTTSHHVCFHVLICLLLGVEFFIYLFFYCISYFCCAAPSLPSHTSTIGWLSLLLVSLCWFVVVFFYFLLLLYSLFHSVCTFHATLPKCL